MISDVGYTILESWKQKVTFCPISHPIQVISVFLYALVLQCPCMHIVKNIDAKMYLYRLISSIIFQVNLELEKCLAVQYSKLVVCAQVLHNNHYYYTRYEVQHHVYDAFSDTPIDLSPLSQNSTSDLLASVDIPEVL